MSKRAQRIKTDFDLRKERAKESKLHGGGRPHYSTKVGFLWNSSRCKNFDSLRKWIKNQCFLLKAQKWSRIGSITYMIFHRIFHQRKIFLDMHRQLVWRKTKTKTISSFARTNRDWIQFSILRWSQDAVSQQILLIQGPLVRPWPILFHRSDCEVINLDLKQLGKTEKHNLEHPICS